MVAWGDVPTWFLVVLGAVGGGAALRQLGLQRVQLHDQQDVIRAQTLIQERQQADQMDVVARTIDGVQAGVLGRDEVPKAGRALVHMVAVVNGSKRPVRDVTCKIEAIQADESIRREKAADLYGELVPYALGPGVQEETFVPQERTSTMPVLRAGHKVAFVWAFTTAQYPRIIPTTRFTDDAGLHWEITVDLHLQKLDSRDW